MLLLPQRAVVVQRAASLVAALWLEPMVAASINVAASVAAAIVEMVAVETVTVVVVFVATVVAIRAAMAAADMVATSAAVVCHALTAPILTSTAAAKVATSFQCHHFTPITGQACSRPSA